MNNNHALAWILAMIAICAALSIGAALCELWLAHRRPRP